MIKTLLPLRLLAVGGLVASLLMTACDGNQQVPGATTLDSKVNGSIKGSFLVTSITPAALAPGDTATIEGVGLSNVEILIDDQPVSIRERQADRSLVFTMPAGDPGLQTLSIRKGGETATNVLIRLAADGSPVVVGGNLKNVCKGERYFTLSGNAIEGQRDCAVAPPRCVQEGDVDCVASNEFPVAEKKTLASRLIEGTSVAGVVGTMSVSSLAPSCGPDTTIGCLSNDQFPAIERAKIQPNTLALGVTLAGIAGNLVIPLPSDVRAGVSYGSEAQLAGMWEPAPSTTPLCTQDGDVNCRVEAGFKAADMRLVTASSIKSGVTIAGMAGAMIASPNPCSADGEANCVVDGTLYKAAKLSQFAAQSLRYGTTIAGVSGSLSNCAGNGVQSCYVTGGYRAASDCTANGSNCYLPAYAENTQALKAINFDTINSNRAQIRSSFTLAGVTGALANCSSDGGQDCVATGLFPAVSLAGLASKVVYGSSVAGTVGSVHVPDPDNVLSGVNVGTSGTGTVVLPTASDVRINLGFGPRGLTLGALGSPAICSSDGETDCLTVNEFPAVDRSGLAEKVLNTAHVAGISGNVILPTPTHVLKDTSYGSLANPQTGTLILPNPSYVLSGSGQYGAPGSFLTPSLTLPPEADVYFGVNYGVSGSDSTGRLTLANGASVRRNHGNFGRGGNSVAPTLDDCTGDGLAGCVTTSVFRSADTQALTENDIKSGKTLAGLSGSLADCAVDGGNSCVVDGVNFRAAKLSHFVAGAIKTGFTVAGVAGSLVNCAIDGAIDCVAVSDFRAANMARALNTHIKSGVTIAGISGTVTPSPSPCTSDGATGCVAVPNYPSARLANFAPTDLKSGVTIAGLAGSLSQCSSNGAEECYATGGYKAATTCPADGTNCYLPSYFVNTQPLKAINFDLINTNADKIRSSLTLAGVSGHLYDCDSDGDDLCVATTLFPAANIAGLAGKVIYGSSIAGIAGSVRVPAPSSVLTGVSVGTSGTGTVVLPGANDVRAGITFGANSSTTGLLNPLAGTPAACSEDGQTDCVANTNFRAAEQVTLANKVVSPMTVAGVQGNVVLPAIEHVLVATPFGVGGNALTGALTLPAANRVLTGSGNYGNPSTPLTPSLTLPPENDVYTGISYGIGGSGATGRLTLATAENVRTSQGSFGRGGNSVSPSLANCASDGGTSCVAVPAYPAAKLANFAPTDLKSSVTVAGISGVLNSCILDGDTNCITTSSYKSANLAGFSGADIKAGKTIAGISGSLANCTQDGGLDCVTVIEFKAADMALALPANIRSGATIAGVPGNVIPSPSFCATDGATGCVTLTSFKAADMTRVQASNIKVGTTIAGMPGSLSPSPASCAVDGATGCVAVTNFPAAKLANFFSTDVKAGITIAGVGGGLNSCATDGGINCITTSMFKSANLSSFAETDIKSGKTIAGVSGTLTNCAIDGGIGCVTVANFRAANMSFAIAQNIKSGATIAGRTGSVIPSPSSCSTDGATGCVTVSSFKAANMAMAVPGNIKAGITIAGVSGAYPSSTYRLPSADSSITDLTGMGSTTAAGSYEWWSSSGDRYTGSIMAGPTMTPATSTQTFSDANALYNSSTVAGDLNLTAGKIKSGTTLFGVVGSYPSDSFPLAGADTTPDLDEASFDAKIKSNSLFEWFDSSGVRYRYSGDSDIVEANIATGVNVFGTVGSATNGGKSECSYDGQVNCTAVSNFPAMAMSNISTWDLRKGKTAGGIAGSLTFYKNMANTALFNRTNGTGALTGIDAFDTIDDYNNGGSFPTQNPSGWDQATGANWQRDSLSDTGTNGSGASNGICDGSEVCVYKDQFTGLFWLKGDGSKRTWEEAIRYCDSTTQGNYQDWRLPTQKELLQAYTNGITSQKQALNLSASLFWSSTTTSLNTSKAFLVELLAGRVYENSKSDNDDYYSVYSADVNHGTICVR